MKFNFPENAEPKLSSEIEMGNVYDYTFGPAITYLVVVGAYHKIAYVLGLGSDGQVLFTSTKSFKSLKARKLIGRANLKVEFDVENRSE